MGELTLGQLQTPAYAPIWNIESNRLEYLGPRTYPDLPVAHAIRMAVSLPLFLEPMPLEGGFWCDGGIVDLFPVHPILVELLELVPYCKVRATGLYQQFLDNRKWPNFIRSGRATMVEGLRRRNGAWGGAPMPVPMGSRRMKREEHGIGSRVEHHGDAWASQAVARRPAGCPAFAGSRPEWRRLTCHRRGPRRRPDLSLSALEWLSDPVKLRARRATACG